MKSTVTPVAELGYLEDGPADGAPVILAHGFPDDARTWDPVVARLSGRPVRLLRPYQRGCGPSKVVEPNNIAGGAQVAALAQDILDFADALSLSRFLLVGHDWGARAGFAAAALAPRRIQQLICLATPYGSGPQDLSLKLHQLEAFWYQFLICTDQGAALLKQSPDELARYLWRRWSPGFRLTDVDFAELSKSFANPQFAATVIHYYRHRSGMAPGAPHYAKQQELLDTMPAIEVPTIFVFGDADGANLASSSRGSDGHFQGPFEPRELAGVGHFIQRERPDAVAALIASATAHCGE